MSAEGCNPLINGVDVTGKIAVIYRNTCEFGTKALNAQNAGAVGVIIINRDPEVIEMGGGADGGSVTIPVVMLSDDMSKQHQFTRLGKTFYECLPKKDIQPRWLTEWLPH